MLKLQLTRPAAAAAFTDEQHGCARLQLVHTPSQFAEWNVARSDCMARAKLVRLTDVNQLRALLLQGVCSDHVDLQCSGGSRRSGHLPK